MKNLRLIPPFFYTPKIGSTPILLQEGTDSFFTQMLFGANVISQKNKIKTINRNWLSYITVVLHTKKNQPHGQACFIILPSMIKELGLKTI